MLVDIALTTWEDWRVGAAFYVAEDMNGMHRCLEIGFLFFTVRVNFYSDDIDPYNPQ